MKGSTLTSKAVPAGVDEIILVDNESSPVSSKRATLQAAVSMGYAHLGFVGNTTAMSAGAIGTTFTDVTEFATEGLNLSDDPDATLNRIVVAGDCDVEINYGLDALNDTGERIIEIRLTKNGSALTGTERLGNAPAANRPVSLQGHFKTSLAANDYIEMEVRNSSLGGAATTGTLTLVNGHISIKRIKNS